MLGLRQDARKTGYYLLPSSASQCGGVKPRARILAVNSSERLICSFCEISAKSLTARAGNRRFRVLSALRAHTKAPYKMIHYENAKGT